MEIKGAAVATVIGQFVAWGLAILFHIIFSKEIKTDFKNFKPDIKCIGAIYKIGWSTNNASITFDYDVRDEYYL